MKKARLICFLKRGKYVHIVFIFKKIAFIASKEKIWVSEGNMKEGIIVYLPYFVKTLDHVNRVATKKKHIINQPINPSEKNI